MTAPVCPRCGARRWWMAELVRRWWAEAVAWRTS